MRKNLVLTGFCVLLAVTGVRAQQDKQLLLQIQNSKTDAKRFDLQLALAEHYRSSSDLSSQKQDSALVFGKKAMALAGAMHNSRLENKARWVLGKIYFGRKDTVNGMAAFKSLREFYHQNNELHNEAEVWSSEAELYPVSGRRSSVYKLSCFEAALGMFTKLNLPNKIAETLQQMAMLHIELNEVKLAEDNVRKALQVQKGSGYKKLHTSYNLLAIIYSLSNTYDKEIFYRLEAIKNMIRTADFSVAADYYYKLSAVYTVTGKREEGLFWLKKAIAAKSKKEIVFYTELINDLTALKRTKEALDTINALAKQPPPVNIQEKVALYQALGFFYTKLHQTRQAEAYYLKMIAVDLQALRYQDSYTYTNLYLAGNDAIAWFYINTRQTPKARKYLTRMLAIYKAPPATIFPVYRMNTYNGMYAVAYESHHYKEAIHYLQLHKNLYDSVFNAEKNRQFEEFKVKYETDQKEKDIRLLETRARAQEVILQKARLQRNITFAGIAMFMIIAGSVYKGYRDKQRGNRILQAKQVEINEQNDALRSLVQDKEWLLKEVHHRVKNNLQIVMSLLSSQSAYLENNAAIEAIRESQSRVQAISLIHQKLYTSNNVANINMQAYVSDLVSYLADSFSIRQRGIQIEQVVELFNLDISQAVPLGLILNESVTNAIKYAFGEKGGQIIIALQLINNQTLLMTIADNGRGLPGDFDIRTASSLGMEMMKALSKQLGGAFSIKNNSGVHISIEFVVAKIQQGNAAAATVAHV